MGNVHTPRPIYFDGGVIDFFMKNKQMYFKTLIWIKDGSKQFEYESGKFNYQLNQDENNRTVADIIKSAQQKFTGVVEK